MLKWGAYEMPQAELDGDAGNAVDDQAREAEEQREDAKEDDGDGDDEYGRRDE